MKDNNTNVFLGVLIIIFGLVFLIAPESVFASIVLIAGILIIIFGLLKILGAMKEDSSYKAYTIVSAIFSIVFGVLLIIYRDTTVKILAEFVGIWFLLSGIFTLLMMLKSNIKGKLLSKPIIKIIIGLVALIIPVLPIKIAGIMIGVILILAGLSVITTKKEEEVIYKVKVKK